MIQNKVKYWADQRGWTKEELYAHAVIQKAGVGKSTVDRFYSDPTYLGNPATIAALAKLLGVSYTEMLADVDASGQGK